MEQFELRDLYKREVRERIYPQMDADVQKAWDFAESLLFSLCAEMKEMCNAPDPWEVQTDKGSETYQGSKLKSIVTEFAFTQEDGGKVWVRPQEDGKLTLESTSQSSFETSLTELEFIVQQVKLLREAAK